MPRAKRTEQPEPPAPPPAGNGPGNDVLTLAEAAAYLRLPEKDIIDAVSTQGFPGRQVGGEWRFFRAAIQRWLCTHQPVNPLNAAMMSFAGAWEDDPYLEDMVEEIYRARGRPITEDGSYRLFHGLKHQPLKNVKRSEA